MTQFRNGDGSFLKKEPSPFQKKEKNNANNKSQKQKENEKHTFHNIFNFIITAI